MGPAYMTQSDSPNASFEPREGDITGGGAVASYRLDGLQISTTVRP